MNRLTVDTPLGDFHLLEDAGRLLVACFSANRQRFEELFNAAHDFPSPVLLQARRELDEYFAGRRLQFTVPLTVPSLESSPKPLEIGTQFETRAWEILLKISYGRRISYKEQALWMGHPKAVRAVGRANGKNPLSIFVPCHRVVGSHGALTGYAGGLACKQFLLDHEMRVL